MKQFNIFGELNNSRVALKNKIVNEINRRYPLFHTSSVDDRLKEFETETQEALGGIINDYKPCFPLFMFKHQEKPTYCGLMRNLFGGYRVTNPLAYAKKLVYDASPKTNCDDELEQLHQLAEKIRKQHIDDYDFEIDGVPVKIYQKFIQVGYDIIPINNYTGFFNSLKNKEKKENILRIIVNINNSIHIAA